MRLDEILLESVNFGVSRLVDRDGRKYYTDPFEEQHKVGCWVCNGSGEDPYQGGECGMCDGSGEIKEWKTPYEKLNVTNANARLILDMLGTQHDDNLIGVWEKKDLPLIRRKLIVLKNKGTSQYVQDPSKVQGSTHVTKDDGISKIGRGPTIYHGGHSQNQINQYIDTLLHIIDFAQKNDAVVTWS